MLALFLASLPGTAVHTGLLNQQTFDVMLPVCKLGGTLFLNALKLLVIPLIAPSIICGMMSISADKHFGRIGSKVLVYYLSSGLLAILVGLLCVNIIKPGQVDKDLAIQLTEQITDGERVLSLVENRSNTDLIEVILRFVPENIIAASANNNELLGVIFFAMLFGFFITKTSPEHQDIQRRFWESILAVISKIAHFIISFTPYGVFCLILPILLETGFAAFKPVSLFFITVVLALGIHMFVTLPLALRAFGLSAIKHYKAVWATLLTAFSTASSASTLPITLKNVQNDVGVSNRISSFTLPLGATVNMDGTALYECVVVIFIAQICGVAEGFQLLFRDQFYVVVLALLTSIGVAGIPSASLVAISLILGALGIPLEYIGIVIVVDRILDMCRTSVNVLSDTCGAAIIAQTEGEDLKVSIERPGSS